MFKKFMALFTWWKSRDRGDTLKTPDTPWPRLAGTNRRIQPEQIQPFNTGTPHSRMHDLIIAGKPDALIAIELGVDISAVRNYRHIISARGREAARRAAGSGLPPRVLDTAWMNRERSDHREWRRREAARYERVPAALLRRAEQLDERVRISGATLAQMDARAVSSPLYDPNLSQSVTTEGCARVRTTLDELARIESQCPAPADDHRASGQGGDFGGAGATGSWDGEQP